MYTKNVISGVGLFWVHYFFHLGMYIDTMRYKAMTEIPTLNA